MPWMKAGIHVKKWGVALITVTATNTKFIVQHWQWFWHIFCAGLNLSETQNLFC